MAAASSSDPLPVSGVSTGVADTVAVDNQREGDLDESDRKFAIHRQLTFTLSYNTQGTVKPRYIRRFVKWLRKA